MRILVHRRKNISATTKHIVYFLRELTAIQDHHRRRCILYSNILTIHSTRSNLTHLLSFKIIIHHISLSRRRQLQGQSFRNLKNSRSRKRSGH
jgi:hypothetical protein